MSARPPYSRGMSTELPAGLLASDFLDQLEEQVRTKGGVILEVVGQSLLVQSLSTLGSYDVYATTTRKPQLLLGEVPRLTSRQIEILRMTAKGLTGKQVAEALNVSVSTVMNHLVIVRHKFNVSRTVEAIAIARHEGLLNRKEGE